MRKSKKILAAAALAMAWQTACAQTSFDHTSSCKAWEIDSAASRSLSLKINSTLFFQDNEFSTPMMKGYTLPGFRLCPTLSYQPSSWISMELGVFMLKFWGTDSYPNLAYKDISQWTGRENAAKGFHLSPYFRVQMATKGGLNIVLGSLYSARHHRLLEPLYAPELNFTADPEAGVQLIYNNRWLDMDAWVNWESFIYKNDTHQEAFTFGVSSRLKYNSEERKVHLYTPVQLLIQHRGGEIDTLYDNSVQTLINGAVGVGARFDINHRALKSFSLEGDALYYEQQSGKIWPFKRGWAAYLHGKLDIANVRVRVGYVYSRKFTSLFGYPFFGSVSASEPGLVLPTNSTLFAGVEFHHEFHPGYLLGVSAMAYQHFPSTGYIGEETRRYGSKNSFYAAIFFRLSPSFLLKRFGDK